MSTIQRKPPIKARNYQKKLDTVSVDNSLIGIADVSRPDDLFLAPVNTSVSTFDGFFGEKPTQLSLTYELCDAYSNLFLNTSQYLWGPKSSASLLKTIQELMALREFDDEDQGGSKQDSEEQEAEGKEGENTQNRTKIKLSKKTQVLQKAGEALYKELENRETINNNMLIGNLLGMVSS
jgi:hypothetical protein